MGFEGDEPLWSVVIPTHNPSIAYLKEALRSVLDQDLGPVLMQIVIVDDGSVEFDPESFLGDLDESGRVSWVRGQGEHGIGENWNRCLAQARGQWIHLLHQDDRVLPGFYERLGQALQRNQEIGAAFCCCAMSDDAGRRTGSMASDAPRGILQSWQQDVFVWLRIAAPAMVVRRSVYETLGGFDTSFRYALDWDMWKRIAVRYPIWYEPEPLVAHRVHAGATTRSLQSDGENLREIRRSITKSQQEFGACLAPDIEARARRAYARFGVQTALKLLLRSGDLSAARNQLREARVLSSGVGVLWFLLTETLLGVLHRLRAFASKTPTGPT